MRCLCLLLLALLLFTGCDRDRAFYGKWVFDRAYTEARMAENPPPQKSSDSILGGLKEGLTKMLSPVLLEKLEGANLIITKNEIMMTSKEGSGRAESYEIVDRPTQNSWRVKTADGKIETYTREGDWLYAPTTGDVNFRAYFRKAER